MAYPYGAPYELWIVGFVARDSPKWNPRTRRYEQSFKRRVLKIGLERDQLQLLQARFTVSQRTAKGRFETRRERQQEALAEALEIYSDDWQSWLQWDAGSPISWSFFRSGSPHQLDGGHFS